jgi:ankyrin repeat protein
MASAQISSLNRDFLSAAKIAQLNRMQKLKNHKERMYFEGENSVNALHLAARFNAEILTWLLDCCGFREHIEARGQFGRTPFLAAAKQGHLAALNCLKDRRANMDARDENGADVLHLAALSGNVEVLSWLLDSCDFKARYNRHHPYHPPNTIFLAAATKGDRASLRYLTYTHKMGGQDRDENGNNALHLVALSGNVETLTWLLDDCGFREHIEARGQFQRTAFLDAATKGHLAALQLLKARGANVQGKDQGGNNALHLAATFSGNVETLTWLLDDCGFREHIEARGQFQRTAFLGAATKGHLAALQLLKARGANVQARDENSANALHLAALSGKAETLRWLLDDCDFWTHIEAPGQFQRTAFLAAAEQGHLAALRLLKDRGANVQARDEDGFNALDLAKAYAPQSSKDAAIQWLHWNLDY